MGRFKNLNAVMIETAIDGIHKRLVGTVNHEYLKLRHGEQFGLSTLPYVDLNDPLATLYEEELVIHPLLVYSFRELELPLFLAVLIDTYQMCAVN